MKVEELFITETKLFEAASKKFYFAIRINEIKKQNIHYPKTNKYTHKGVHTSLNALIDFIREEFPKETGMWYYITLDSSDVNIDNSVKIEGKMVSVKLPFTINLRNKRIHKLPMRKR